MDSQPSLSALEQAQQVIDAFNIANATLFDHKPVLRIQVPDSEFARVLELRTTLVDSLKPTGFRFIALDLGSNTEM